MRALHKDFMRILMMRGLMKGWFEKQYPGHGRIHTPVRLVGLVPTISFEKQLPGAWQGVPHPPRLRGPRRAGLAVPENWGGGCSPPRNATYRAPALP